MNNFIASIYANWINNFYIQQNIPENYILHRCAAGLGDKFGCLYINWLYSRKLKKNIYVYWDKYGFSGENNIFSFLFENMSIDGVKIETVPTEFIEPVVQFTSKFGLPGKDLLNRNIFIFINSNGELECIERRISFRDYHISCDMNNTEAEEDALTQKVHIDHGVGRIKFHYRYKDSEKRLKIINHSDEDYLRFNQKLFASIKDKDIEREALSFVAEKLDGAIGIHIRHGNGEFISSIRSKTLPIYCIKKYVKYLRDNYPDRKKFLSTDSIDIQNYFLYNLKDVIIYPKYFNRSGTGCLHKETPKDMGRQILRDGLMEIFILSYLKELHLGNRRSNFSFLPVVLHGDKKVTIIRDLIKKI